MRVAAPGARAAYLRLGVGCAAMAAMLLPSATATAAAPPMDHQHHDHLAAVGVAAMTPPPALLLVLLVGVGAILLVRLVGSLRRSTPLPGRLAACCDVAMAAAMGTMLVAML